MIVPLPHSNLAFMDTKVALPYRQQLADGSRVSHPFCATTYDGAFRHESSHTALNPDLPTEEQFQQ